MTLPMRRHVSEEDASAIKNDVYARIRDALYHGDTADEVLEKLDELAGPDFDTLTLDDLRGMDAETINRNWPTVARVLESGGRAPLAEPDEPSEQSPPPRKTGEGVPNDPGDGMVKPVLSMAMLRNQSVEWHRAHQAEVDEFLSRGGR